MSNAKQSMNPAQELNDEDLHHVQGGLTILLLPAAQRLREANVRAQHVPTARADAATTRAAK